MYVEVFSRPNCGHCVNAKELLKRNNIQYQEYVIGLDITREEVMERFPGVQQVPVVVINHQYLGGYQELEKYLTKWTPLYATIMEALHWDYITVKFRKKDGTERIMRCTRNPNEIPAQDLPKDDVLAEETGKIPNLEVIKAYEPGVGWRSFRIDSVISMAMKTEYLSDSLKGTTINIEKFDE